MYESPIKNKYPYYDDKDEYIHTHGSPVEQEKEGNHDWTRVSHDSRRLGLIGRVPEKEILIVVLVVVV